MKNEKRRISTTISSKYWEMLKKHEEKFETQQKVLEHALENLENGSKQAPAPSPEEQQWIACREMRSICLIHIDHLKALTETADFGKITEVITGHRPAEYQIINYYQKPLKKCSLKEVIDGLILIIRTQNVADAIDYTDDGDYYTLMLIHSLNLNISRIFKILNESLFEAYGVETESELSENSLCMKVFKNNR